MQTIRLNQDVWTFDETKPLGEEGGFGAVFVGESATGMKVAVKRLHLDADVSAHRELRIASNLAGKNLKHVIPVFDSGEDPETGRYFIVMALAEGSLQATLDSGRTFTASEIVDVLAQVATGLAELEGMVHRDLKPANILRHEGAWKIADFGIGAFVEESTSLQTLKACLSPHYAAPEQWEYQRASGATDLYALGCIAYRLFAGEVPFTGRSMEALREQHLHEGAAPLPDSVSPRMKTLVGMLLRKAPQSRPPLKRILQMLEDAQTASPSPSYGVAEAAARLEQARAQADSLEAVQRTADNQREQLARSGRATIAHLVTEMRRRILRNAPSAAVDNGPYVSLGQAQISLPIARNFDFLKTVPPGSFPQSHIDVVLARTLELHQLQPRYVWSSSLLFCRLPDAEEYRWYEVSFMEIFGAGNVYAPFSLLEQTDGARSRYQHADLALSTVMHKYQAAFGPVPIDDEDEEAFLERWMNLFAKAAEGKLRYPSRLPLDPEFWEKFSVYGI